MKEFEYEMKFNTSGFFQKLHPILRHYLVEKKISFCDTQDVDDVVPERKECPPYIFYSVSFLVDLANIKNAVFRAELRCGWGTFVDFSIQNSKDNADNFIAVPIQAPYPFDIFKNNWLIYDSLDMIFAKANTWDEGQKETMQ